MFSKGIESTLDLEDRYTDHQQIKKRSSQTDLDEFQTSYF